MMVPNLDNDDDSKNDENHLRRSRSESLPNSYSMSDAQQNYQMNTPTAFQRRAERQVSNFSKSKIVYVKNDSSQ